MLKTEDIKLPSGTYKHQVNHEMKIAIPTFERVEIKDEWNCDEMCDI